MPSGFRCEHRNLKTDLDRKNDLCRGKDCGRLELFVVGIIQTYRTVGNVTGFVKCICARGGAPGSGGEERPTTGGGAILLGVNRVERQRRIF